MDAAPDAFAQFYAAYPRKRARLDAEKAWKQVSQREPNLLALCLSALEWQRNLPQWRKEGGQFTPYPASYLRSGQFYDDPPAAVVDSPARQEFAKWQASYAHDPQTANVTFEQFERFREARRRA